MLYQNAKCLIEMSDAVSKCDVFGLKSHVNVTILNIVLMCKFMLSRSTEIRAQCVDAKSPGHFVSGSWQDGVPSNQKVN